MRKHLACMWTTVRSQIRRGCRIGAVSPSTTAAAPTKPAKPAGAVLEVDRDLKHLQHTGRFVYVYKFLQYPPRPPVPPPLSAQSLMSLPGRCPFPDARANPGLLEPAAAVPPLIMPCIAWRSLRCWCWYMVPHACGVPVRVSPNVFATRKGAMGTGAVLCCALCKCGCM